jgi:DNA polymerase III subunit gamma/tau
MPLHIDYRPATLDEVVGNDSIKESLMSIFSREDKPHAYLFYGQSGTGKTTFARIMATMLNCSAQDFFEFNMSNLRGIDHVRELAVNCQYSPVDGKVKVYLLDEVHRQTQDAQHAILKILEDTPAHVYFILCTTEPERLLKTIHTRCSGYQTQSLDNKKMKVLIKRVLEQERVEDFSATVINEIIRVSDGSPRQALVILDQVIDMDDSKALAAVASFSVVEAEAIDICRAIVGQVNWETLRPLVKATLLTTEPEKLRYAVLGYLSSILLNKSDDRISELIDLFSENTFSSGKAGIINMCYLASKN